MTARADETKGRIIYDAECGHVCTCTEIRTLDDGGYPLPSRFRPTVRVDRSIAPTETGSWYYRCYECGAGGWSGC